MAKIRMTANRGQRYARKWYSEGEEFEVTEVDAKYLEEVGAAARVEQPKSYRAIEVQDVVQPDVEHKPRRQYRRRDLTAES